MTTRRTPIKRAARSVVTPELRAWYRGLREPSFERHSELGLKLWHDWIVPGAKNLEEEIERAAGWRPQTQKAN